MCLAAVLSCGHGAMLGHWRALFHWGIDGRRRDRIHVVDHLWQRIAGSLASSFIDALRSRAATVWSAAAYR